MKNELIARVLLMPDGTIHIAYMNKQTYYCTAEALLLLLTDPSNFVLKGHGRLSTSTLLVNKRQENVEEIRGLTLLTVNSNAQIICEFQVLFQIFLSALADPLKAKMCLHINSDMLQGWEVYYNNSAIFLYFEYCQMNGNHKSNNRKNDACGSRPSVKMLEELLNPPDYKASTLCAYKNKNQNDLSASTEPDSSDTLQEPIKTTSQYKKGTPPKRFVTIAEYAKIHGFNENTVGTWAWKRKLSSAYKDDKNRWLVDINDKVTDGRAGRTITPLPDGRKRICLKGEDYENVQKYIKERNLVTDNIRSFVRTKEEMKYYELHSYHEVAWETGNAMIIDINPDYFSEKHGKTNRQLIADNKSPVVPKNEDYEYILHHIGQNKDSPLAIIPGNDHGDQKWFSVFHVGKTCSDELHGSDFEKQKRRFWNEYIKMYDQNGGYRGIKYLNPKHKRKAIQ